MAVDFDTATVIVRYTGLETGVSFLSTCSEFYNSFSLWYALCSENLTLAPLCCPPEENLQVYTLTDLRNLAYRTISRMANWSLPQPKLKTFRQYPKPNGPQETLRCVVPGTGLVITTTHLQTTLTLSCVDGLSGRIVDRLTWERILKSGGPSDDGWKAEQGRFVLAFVVTPVSGNPLALVTQVDFSDRTSPRLTCLYRAVLVQRQPSPEWLLTAPHTFWSIILHKNFLTVSRSGVSYEDRRSRYFGVLDLKTGSPEVEVEVEIPVSRIRIEDTRFTTWIHREFVYNDEFYHGVTFLKAITDVEFGFPWQLLTCYFPFPLSEPVPSVITGSQITHLPCFQLDPLARTSSVPFVEEFVPRGRCSERGLRLLYESQSNLGKECSHLLWVSVPTGFNSPPTSYVTQTPNRSGSVYFHMGYAERYVLIENRQSILQTLEPGGVELKVLGLFFELLEFSRPEEPPEEYHVHRLTTPEGFRFEEHLDANQIQLGNNYEPVIDEYLGYIMLCGKEDFFFLSYA